jgi:hypothetical protein
MPAGRPTKYTDEHAKTAFKLCLLGHTDAELADFFEVDEATINRWKAKHPEFCESLNKGKDFADAEIAHSLYQRAKGYEHPEDKIFNQNGEPMVVPTIKHYPPDSTALAYWLNNRSRGKFRQRQEVELTAKTKIEELSDEELDEYIRSRSGQ